MAVARHFSGFERGYEPSYDSFVAHSAVGKDRLFTCRKRIQDDFWARMAACRVVARVVERQANRANIEACAKKQLFLLNYLRRLGLF
jgi:hypothetical protein